MICFPNAKINLGLNIVSKRQDGYHNLETIFYPIALKDALEVVPSSESERYRFFPSGITIAGNTRDNLVIKAFELIAAEKKIPPIDIHLLKAIPFGAGLGGGSSDAAFMLKLLNDTFELHYSDEELHRFAAKLGADCSFFIRNKPAFATGIGEILEPIELDLSRYFFVLVKPTFGVPTKDAFAMLSPKEPEISLKEIVKKPISEWRDLMKNDFETPVFRKYPAICAIKEKLYELGALYASMSGSGSSVFAFFDRKPKLNHLFEDCFVWQPDDFH